MDKCAFTNRCIVETIDGLRDGLTHFSGPSRTAVIYSIKPDDPIQIYDPLSLLTGHEPKFKELYIDTDEWRKKTVISYDKKKFSNLIPEKNLGLAGLISYGGRSSSVVYQMWFTEHHPDMCAIGPTERWLEQPILDNVQHIRKLLQSVENSDRKLVADEKTIIGIIKGDKPDFSITADFKGRHGFLKLNNNTICSFSDGSFKSTTRKAKLVQVEEVLLESNMDPVPASALFKIVTSIVHSAAQQRHGCTIVIDLNEKPIFISGHSLEQPLDLENHEYLELTKALSKVDGALHLGADLKLHGFACLLDGHFIPGEDRARGARFNSALRFTAERDNIIVIVVSSDDPVSIMIDGVALNTKWPWKPSLFCNEPVLLEKWVTISEPS